MRVQITKCSNGVYWYRNNIGAQFLVEDVGNDIDYEIMDNGEYLGQWITRTDCIILNEDDHLPPHLREAEDEYIKISDDRRDKILSELDKVEGIINEVPGGSTPSQYQLPDNAIDLQDLIEYRDMNFAMGNIFKACYRSGNCSHSDLLRDINKVIWFANRELERLKGNK